jgi:hypothetical protein
VWLPCNNPQWLLGGMYRVKPQPHKHQDLIDAARGGDLSIQFEGVPGSWYTLASALKDEYKDAVPLALPIRRAHKWQKEMDAYAAGKTIQWRNTLSWVPVCQSWRDCVKEEGPAWLVSSGHEYRIKPESVSFICRVEVPHGFSPKIVSSWRREKPTSATWDENLKLTFEDGKLIGAEVLKC